MTQPFAAFPPAEHRARLATARAALRRAGLAGCVCVAPEHHYHLFGYDSWVGVNGFQAVVFGSEGDDPTPDRARRRPAPGARDDLAPRRPRLPPQSRRSRRARRRGRRRQGPRRRGARRRGAIPCADLGLGPPAGARARAVGAGRRDRAAGRSAPRQVPRRTRPYAPGGGPRGSRAGGHAAEPAARPVGGRAGGRDRSGRAAGRFRLLGHSGRTGLGRAERGRTRHTERPRDRAGRSGARRIRRRRPALSLGRHRHHGGGRGRAARPATFTI